MDISRRQYYVPRDRVFVNNRKRSSSLNTIKTHNFLELNRTILEQSLTSNSLHTVKRDSNFLLGSSIVNLNFVNNVSHPVRGYEGYRNYTVLNNSPYSRNNLECVRYDLNNSNELSRTQYLNSYDNGLPYENYNYNRYYSETHTPTTKSNLNGEDKIITPRGQKSRSCPSIGEIRDLRPILTKNYLSNSSKSLSDVNNNSKEFKEIETNCTKKDDRDSKNLARKTRLGEYLEKVANINDKVENVAKKPKITIGRPTHEYIAQYPDPVEKELEKWHNSHNSTLKWERVKHGLYSVGGMIVHLVKSNGGLYVQGHGFKKYKGQMPIFRFVEEKELQLLKEKSKNI